MQKLISTLLISLGLVLTLSVERNVGLPVFFSVGMLWLITQLPVGWQSSLSVIWGIILAVVYLTPFWLGILLVSGATWLFGVLKRFGLNSNRRLILMVLALNLGLGGWLRIMPSVFEILYYGGAIVLITIMLYIIQGWQRRPSKWRISRRLWSS